MIGRTIAHYQVKAKLGVGGMGEVYRATDSRLKRDVAVKYCPTPWQVMPTGSHGFSARPRSWPRSTTPTSRRFFYRTGDTIMSVPLDRDGPLRIGRPRSLFTDHKLSLDRFGNWTFDVAPDGRLLVAMLEADDVRVRIVLDWQPGVAGRPGAP